jgi:Flp pilus assembly protein TadD
MHAEIGLDERAIAELTQAAQLAPQLHVAHFQLGTLLLKRGEVDRAVQAWRPLDVLERNHPLVLFKSAMMRLADADYAGCIAQLRQGIASNDANEALNVEMREVLARTEALLAAEGQAGGAGAPVPVDRDEEPAQHVLLAGYQPPSDLGR